MAVALLRGRLASDRSTPFEFSGTANLSRTLGGSRLRRLTTSPNDLAVSISAWAPSSNLDASMQRQCFIA